MDEADRLTELVRKYARRTGRRPESLQELVAAGVLTRPPLDLGGVPFEYDPESGQVTVSRSSQLWAQP
jgi:hypothetical protein